MSPPVSLPDIIAITSVTVVLVLVLVAALLLVSVRRRRNDTFRIAKEDNDRLARHGGHLAFINVQRNAVVSHKTPKTWRSLDSITQSLSALIPWPTPPNSRRNRLDDEAEPKSPQSSHDIAKSVHIAESVHMAEPVATSPLPRPLVRVLSRRGGCKAGPRALPVTEIREDQPSAKMRDTNRVHKERLKVFQTDSTPVGPRQLPRREMPSRFTGVSDSRSRGSTRQPPKTAVGLLPRPSKKQFIGPREMVDVPAWIPPSPPRNMSPYRKVQERGARDSHESQSPTFGSLESDMSTLFNYSKLPGTDGRKEHKLYEAASSAYSRFELEAAPFKPGPQEPYHYDPIILHEPLSKPVGSKVPYTIHANGVSPEYWQHPSAGPLQYQPPPSDLRSVSRGTDDAAMHPAPLRTASKIADPRLPREERDQSNFLAPLPLPPSTPSPPNQTSTHSTMPIFQISASTTASDIDGPYDQRSYGLAQPMPAHSLPGLPFDPSDPSCMRPYSPADTPSAYNTHPPPTPQLSETQEYLQPPPSFDPQHVRLGQLASQLRRMDSACDARSEDGYFNLTGRVEAGAAMFYLEERYLEEEGYGDVGGVARSRHASPLPGLLPEAYQESYENNGDWEGAGSDEGLMAAEELRAVFAGMTEGKVRPTLTSVALPSPLPKSRVRVRAKVGSVPMERDKTPWGRAIASM